MHIALTAAMWTAAVASMHGTPREPRRTGRTLEPGRDARPAAPARFQSQLTRRGARSPTRAWSAGPAGESVTSDASLGIS